MLWVILCVALAVAGLVVLAVAGVRLYRQFRELAQAVTSASQRIAVAAGELERAAKPAEGATERSVGGSPGR